MAKWNTVVLRDVLTHRLSLGELQNAAHDVGPGYDALPGDGQIDKTRELISYLDRRKQLDELVAWVKKYRPDISTAEFATKELPTPPAPVYPFADRTRELDTARPVLLAGHPLHISGLGGIGKTEFLKQLLAEVRVRKAFPGGVVWVDGVRVGAADFRTELARSFGLQLDPKTLDDQLRSHLVASRALVVYDGANDADQLVAASLFVQQISPRLAVTSYDRRGAPFTLVALSSPDVDDAIAIFIVIFRLHAKPDSDSPSDTDMLLLRDVVDAVGCHPLALRLAAVYAVEESVPLDRLRDRLRKQPLDRPTADRDVRRAFELSCDRLDETQRWLFSLASLFDPTGATLAAWAATSDLEEQACEDALGILVRHSLLDRRGNRYPIQPLLHQFANEKWKARNTSEASAACDRLTAYYLAWAKARALEGTTSDSALAAELANLECAIGHALKAGAWEDVWVFATLLNDFSLRAGHWATYRNLWTAARDAMQSLSDLRRESDALHHLGWIAKDTGDHSASREYFSQALAIARQLGDRARESDALNSLGWIAKDTGDNSAARENFEQALAIAHQLGDRARESDALNNLGLVVKDVHDYAAARANFEQALAITRELEDHARESVALNSLGWIAKDTGDYSAARENFEQALAIARQLGDRAKEGDGLNNLGIVAYCKGDYPAARENFEQALAITRELGDRARESDALNDLGLVAKDTGDYPTARDYFEQARTITHELGNRAKEGHTLNNLGWIAMGTGEHSAARDCFVQALAITRQLGDRARESDALNDLGLVAKDTGDYPTARDYFEQARTITHELGDRARESDTLNNLGWIAKDTRDYATARGYFEQARTITHELGDRAREGHTLENLGWIAKDTRDYPTARGYFEQALAIFEAIGARKDATIIHEALATLQPDDTE
jgi:tetratricopeptide (TPR) repeat protein